MSTLVKNGERLHAVGDTNFTLDRRFSDLKEIGRGSYGVVCSALDQRSKKRVAIKKIVPMAKHTVDAKHVLREIRLMRHMGKHENVISLEDLVVRESADELYIVMDLTDSDLHRVLQSKQVLTESHFKLFMHQLLCGVKYLRDNRIIHRDLKPGNLLVTRDCKLRITDFGLARERPTGKDGEDPDGDVDTPMTEHVVTRWYRPPELMLCPDGLYTYAVDMWSCGCILAEMLGRRPLFPGKNFVHQLSLIFDVIGTPAAHQVGHIKNSQAKKFLESQHGKRKVPLSLVYPEASPEATALLDDMLHFDPNARIDVDSALACSFLAATAVSSTVASSLVYPDTSPDFEFSFERRNYSKFQLKQMIIDEAETFRREHALQRRVAAAAAEVQAAVLVDETGAAAAVAAESTSERFSSATGLTGTEAGVAADRSTSVGNERHAAAARRYGECGGAAGACSDDDEDEGEYENELATYERGNGAGGEISVARTGIEKENTRTSDYNTCSSLPSGSSGPCVKKYGHNTGTRSAAVLSNATSSTRSTRMHHESAVLQKLGTAVNSLSGSGGASRTRATPQALGRTAKTRAAAAAGSGSRRPPTVPKSPQFSRLKRGAGTGRSTVAPVTSIVAPVRGPVTLREKLAGVSTGSTGASALRSTSAPGRRRAAAGPGVEVVVVPRRREYMGSGAGAGAKSSDLYGRGGASLQRAVRVASAGAGAGAGGGRRFR